MSRHKEKKAYMQQNRGFSLMPVAHDGAPIVCIEGVPTEVAPDVFVTVDALSEIALVEVGAVSGADMRSVVSIGGQDILDVSQLSRGSVMSINSRDYVFLKYMDVYLQPRVLGEALESVVSEEISVAQVDRPARPVVVDLNHKRPTLPTNGKNGRVRRLAVVFGPVAALLLSANFLMFFPSKQQIPLEDRAEKVVQEFQYPSEKVPGKKADDSQSNPEAPQTLRELMADPEPRTATQVVVGKSQIQESQSRSLAEAATLVKQEPTNQVKKKVPVAVQKAAPPASQPSLSSASLKALESEYEEAVLIRGYDRDRSVKMLQQLRKKVPAGTALRQKVEAALKN